MEVMSLLDALAPETLSFSIQSCKYLYIRMLCTGQKLK